MLPDAFRPAVGTVARTVSAQANNGSGVVLRRMLAVIVCAALLGCGAAEPPSGDASQASASDGDVSAAPVAQTLRVAVVYDDERIGVHFEFPTEQPSWYHQYWVRERGEWVRRGSGADGPDPDGFYEDRISMLLDDGSVEGFDRFGGWMTAHDGMRSLPDAVPPEDVTAHPVLGESMGRRDVRKYLPQTREVADPAMPSWYALVDDARLEALRDSGAFLDLWQWRAHRSHPVGYADNGYVLHYRLASAGRGSFTDNVDPDTGGPARMFDASVVAGHALSVERLQAREYGQEDIYFISENNSVPYDPDVDWQDGDAIPHRLLREPDGSRGAIRATGRWHDGAWRIALTRSLATPDPRDSKALAPGQRYSVAFAVHTGATGARWHLVTLPQVLALGDDPDADLRARRVGDVDAPGELDWTALDLVSPGTVTWQWMHDAHPGSDLIRDGRLSIRDVHDAATLPALIDEAGHAGDAQSLEPVGSKAE